MDLRQLFRSPPAEYAPTSFWFWNSALEIPELLRQVEEHNAKGVRGFFMHARGGLTSPGYLSKGWFDCIEAVVKRAAELGCKAWLYDETGWPSGTAGGRIPRRGPAWQQHFLECRGPGIKAPADLPVDPEPIATARVSGKRLTFHVGRQPHYIDTLDPRTTRAFIRATHDAYLERIGKFFGDIVPGAFTDEPSHRAYNLREHLLRTPWTPRLPDEFRRRRGYDLLPHLASLFFDVGGFRRIRYDYHLTVSELFVEGYGQPLFDWHQQHGIAFTGHYEYEVPIRGQVRCLTSAMPLYEYMQIPGLDMLGKRRPQYERIESIVLAKQPSSVAHQLGRSRVLVEAFGTAGWHFGPQAMRWMGDWLFALGANLICMHAFFYSIAGRRKFDAPPDLFFRQPWWPISRTLHDHMARLSLLLSRGKPMRDVLVIHPIATAWITHRPQDHAGRCDYEPDPLGRAFASTLDALVRSHHDFDLGDERLLARHGRVLGSRLHVGQASYSCVVVPPGTRTLDASTRALLERLAAGGGRVIGFHLLPRLTAGRRDPEAAASLVPLARTIHGTSTRRRLASLVRVLDLARPDRTRVTGPRAGQIALHERQLPAGSRILFLANSDTPAADVHVTIAGRWSVEEWHTADGSHTPVPTARRRHTTELHLRFAPMGCRLFFLSKAASRVRRPARPHRERVIHEFARTWQARPGADNVLVFDICRLRLGQGRWSKPIPVFQANRRLAKREDGRFDLRFEFTNRMQEPCTAALALEDSDRFRLRVNGSPVPLNGGDGFFLDPACARTDVSAHLRSGANRVELSGRTGGPMLQNVYLLGDFGVAQEEPGRFGITDPPTRLRTRGWQASGYPFFAGPMTYSQDVEIAPPLPKSVLLRIQDLCEAASVFVNGRHAGDTLWQPFEIEVGDLLQPGVNRVDLRVYGNLRNTLGPWHLPRDREIVGFSQDHFEDAAGWHDAYDFIPMGLLGPVRLIAR